METPVALPHSVEGDYFYSLLIMSVTNMSICLAATGKKKVPTARDYEAATEPGYEEQLTTQEEGGIKGSQK